MNIQIQLDNDTPVDARVKARKKLNEGDVVFVSFQPKVWVKVLITALVGPGVYQVQQL